MLALRPFQVTATEEIRHAYRLGHRTVLFVLPTGGGKTFTFVHVAERAAARQNRTLILVHRQELVDQASRAIDAVGCPHGVIASGYRMDLRYPVQVASVQTLVKRLHLIPHDWFQLVVVDEAHHAVAGTWATILTSMPNARVLGVTATPERLDGKCLGGMFQVMILGPDAAWLTDEGFLTRAKIYHPKGLDLSMVKRVDSRKGKQEAGEILRRRQFMGDAVTHYSRTIAPLHNGTAIAFTPNLEVATTLSEAFREAGISSAVIDGKLDRRQRRRMIRDLGDASLKVLVSVDVISEGTDIPSVAGAILYRPTDSLTLFLQQVGRVLRPIYATGFDLDSTSGRLAAIERGGKPFAVINDHVGNSYIGDVVKHGTPTDYRPWSLEGKVAREKAESAAPPIKICPACCCQIPSISNPCPECGHQFEVIVREMQVVEGDLEELDPELAKRQSRREVAQARTKEELEAIARERGYKPGWVTHMLNARGGRNRYAQAQFR
jgi:superfamily II DNA or RNA helicase